MVKYCIVPSGEKRDMIGDEYFKHSRQRSTFESDTLPRIGELFNTGRRNLSYRVVDVVHLGDEKVGKTQDSKSKINISHYVIVDPISEEEHLKYFFK
ncbi:MAG: hypothetical protein AABX93_01915 [Nanoarchaeota archaeon]